MEATQSQYAVTVWVPFFTGHLSVFGSGWILWHVFWGTGASSGTSRQFRNHSAVFTPGAAQSQNITWLAAVQQKLQQKPHLRILLGLSAYDLMGSWAMAWTFVLSPRGESGWDGAFGSMASCRFQGFLIQAGCGVALYNAMLSLYYYLTICRGIRLETWWQMERIVHIFTFLVAMSLAVAGAATNMFNPIYGYCYIAPYPSMCGAKEPCDTWFSPQDIGWILQVWGHWMMQFALVVVVVCNFLIWRKVLSQSRRLTRYSIKKTSTTSVDPREAETSESSMVRRFRGSRGSAINIEDKKRNARETLVFQQCFFLTLAFILCAIGPITFHLAMWTNGYTAFWQTIITATLGPLHGFMNFVVFVRPIYLQVRRRFGQQLSRWQTLNMVLFRRDPLAAASQLVVVHSQDVGQFKSSTAANLSSRVDSMGDQIVETNAIQSTDPTNDDEDISDCMSLGDHHETEEDTTANVNAANSPSPTAGTAIVPRIVPNRAPLDTIVSEEISKPQNDSDDGYGLPADEFEGEH
mmetsp:Transcript_5552/g.15690  ORF Transcript_5552/g.15690 Transcript_5552/m.15690 type:complete len:521 (-) Transcript_5552:718-2280(-)|eukprot:CAMPEP_0168749402 /NCGR_PEP_ID=MMETSP0724-20121128/16697_1 /TAXON_ID=265536 /ORGANISM="Amphiprora sp., Strain CCMP467" /LENGTH=520 /DNA_ID=CAMNT_0008797309 /DNA_START=200 /DNA_END=1762 /DNA_ORIENTATION=-